MPQTIHDVDRTILDDLARRAERRPAPLGQVAVASGYEIAPLPSEFPVARVVRHEAGYVAPEQQPRLRLVVPGRFPPLS